MDYKLQNNLDRDERLEVPRLLGHDNTTIIGIAMNKAFCAEIDRDVTHLTGIGKLFQHMGLINESVTSLTQYEELSTRSFNIFLVRALKETLATLQLDFELLTDIKNNPISSNPELLYTGLFNVLKNAGEIQRRTNSLEKVTLRVEASKMPSDALLYPVRSGKHSDFIAFRVHDSGCGFPNRTDLAHYLTTRPEKGRHGFGLYFLGLAARVMEAPIDIKSKPGDATVSIYVPVYPSTASKD